MKFIYWLFIIVAYAHKTVEEHQIRHNNSIHLDCFDVFIPLINRLSNEAKDAAVNCITIAKDERERELTTIKNTRSELFTEVKRIKETLAQCSSRSDHLGYFECLNGIIEVDKKIVEDISMKSSIYSNKLKTIKEQEVRCFEHSVNKVKDKISNGINNLQYCLLSEDTSPSATPGEKLKHDNSISVSRDFMLPPNYNSATTDFPDSVYDDYDYNENNLN